MNSIRIGLKLMDRLTVANQDLRSRFMDQTNRIIDLAWKIKQNEIGFEF